MQFIAEIINIKKETHDVKTFRLKLDKEIDFIPGQYCLVSIRDEEKPFTFASSPTEKFVDLTIKEFGGFTIKLHSLKIGEKLKINGPLGESLNFDESIKDNIVYLAGGSGITPFMSHLRYAVAKNIRNNFTLIFSNKTEKDIIYRKELNKIAIKNNNIKIIYTLTDEIPENWEGEKGRIDKNIINKHINNPKEKLWYCCGPPLMMRSMKEILTNIGVSKDKIRIEDWQLPGKHDEK